MSEVKVVNIDDVAKEPNPSPLFTGSDVTRQPLVSQSQDFAVAVVNFGKGVRNKFHTHDSDQVLIVTAGRGIVATEQEEREVGPGDVILIPKGEKHWHGATEGSEFSHIYVTKAESKVTQLEQ